MAREELIGNARLILGDCREIAETLPRHDAIISDPPYGQRQNTNVTYTDGSKEHGVPQRNGKSLRIRPKVWPSLIHGDDADFDPSAWVGAADRVLLWGAHRFADRLPPGSWLVWDKVPTGKVRDQGDGEAAWVNHDPPRPMRIYRLLWDGICVGSAARSEVTAGQQRVHPAQKPAALMRWCIEQAGLRAGSTVLDPYMGSGSTGVAAAQMGHRFVGIEIEPLYFDIACRRIAASQRQPDLFHAAALPLEGAA